MQECIVDLSGIWGNLIVAQASVLQKEIYSKDIKDMDRLGTYSVIVQNTRRWKFWFIGQQFKESTPVCYKTLQQTCQVLHIKVSSNTESTIYQTVIN